MFINKYKPVWSPDDETGAAETEIDTSTTETTEDSGEPQLAGKSSLRKSLESGFEKSRKAADEGDGQERRDKKGKFTKGTRRVAGGAEIESTETEETDTDTGDEGETEQPQTTAPEAFGKDLGATWAELPPQWQAAIVKREADTQKGVDELKGKYKALDDALAPHLNVIRQNNQTPAAAVTQLFAWMQALAGNPAVAFPALAKSFGYDLAKFVPNAAPQQGTQDNQQAQATTGEQPAGDVPPAVQAYISKLEAKLGDFEKSLGGIQNNFQQETQQRTNQVLQDWAKDKPHFEAVRTLMASLLERNQVPLKENGQVDLDKAYDMAVFANPEVRAKVLAEQAAKIEADRKAKDAAAKKKAAAEAEAARKKSISVPGSAPGDPGAPSKPKGRGKSVRESLMEAREQLSE